MSEQTPTTAPRGRGRGGSTAPGRGGKPHAPETKATAPFVKKEKVPLKISLESTTHPKIADTPGVKDPVVVLITDGSTTYQVNFHRPVGGHDLSSTAFLRCNPQETQELSMRRDDPRSEERRIKVREAAMTALVGQFPSTLKIIRNSEMKIEVWSVTEPSVYALARSEDGKSFLYQERFAKELVYYKQIATEIAKRKAYETKLGIGSEIPQFERLAADFKTTKELLDSIRNAVCERQYVALRSANINPVEDWSSGMDEFLRHIKEDEVKEARAAAAKATVNPPGQKVQTKGLLCAPATS